MATADRWPTKRWPTSRWNTIRWPDNVHGTNGFKYLTLNGKNLTLNGKNLIIL